MDKVLENIKKILKLFVGNHIKFTDVMSNVHTSVLTNNENIPYVIIEPNSENTSAGPFNNTVTVTYPITFYLMFKSINLNEERFRNKNLFSFSTLLREELAKNKTLNDSVDGFNDKWNIIDETIKRHSLLRTIQAEWWKIIRWTGSRNNQNNLELLGA